MIRIKTIVGGIVLLASGVAFGQVPTWTAPVNVVQFSSSAAVETPQDWLRLVLSATREGSDPAEIQSQLKSALDTALSQARSDVQPEQLEVHSGSFNLSPRYSREGKIGSWQGTADIVIEGRDIARIAKLAGRIDGMNVESMSFDLSRAQRAKVESQAQGQAIENFKLKAGELAHGFGFSGYSLREVSISTNGGGRIQPRIMAMQSRTAAADSAPVPVAPGKTSVIVTVSGSVQLK